MFQLDPKLGLAVTFRTVLFIFLDNEDNDNEFSIHTRDRKPGLGKPDRKKPGKDGIVV